MSYDLNVQQGLPWVAKSQDVSTQRRPQSGMDDRFWQQVFAEAGRLTGEHVQRDALLGDQRSVTSALIDGLRPIAPDTSSVFKQLGHAVSQNSMLGERDVSLAYGQSAEEGADAAVVGVEPAANINASLASNAAVTISTVLPNAEQIEVYRAGTLDASRDKAYGKYAFTLVKSRNGLWVIYLRAPEAMSKEQALIAAAHTPLSQLKNHHERVQKVYLNGHLIYQFQAKATDHMSAITTSTGANRGHVQGSITS